jgi:sRNA-binding regulator protein Hfq
MPSVPEEFAYCAPFVPHRSSFPGKDRIMSTRDLLPAVRNPSSPSPSQYDPRARRSVPVAVPFHLAAREEAEDSAHRQAELFYLQKQIQSQTPMVIVLEDGEQIEGQIEWYDRNSLKVRGRVKALIYKSAIKYMYKLGDAGQ